MNSIKMLEGRTWLLGLAALVALAASDVRAENCDAPPTSGDAYNLVNRGSGYALDVAGNSSQDGANVLQWSEHGGTNQQFLATDLGNGYWSLLAVHSGSSLEVADSSSSDGANVQQMTYDDGATNQQWQFKKSSSGGFAVVARHSGKPITAESSSRGANVSQTTLSGDSLQRWYFNPVDGNCDGPTGFAAQSGSDGLTTTTGGGNATPVPVTTCSALKTALEAEGAAVVQVPDNTTIDCLVEEGVALQVCEVACPDYQDPGEFTLRVPGSTQTCTELGSDTNDTVTSHRFDTRIQVADDKTLVGLGPNSGIEGASLILSGSKNVIVRNLSIANVNPHLVEAGDGITVDNASHVWIDHVAFSMISDGHVDTTNSENVTLSWNHFDGRNNYVCANQHWYVALVGDSQVSYHHNFFDYTGGRNPKVDGSTSRAHLYNNYYKKITYFGISTNDNAHALVEANNFDDTRSPHWNVSGFMSASGNVYTGQSATDPERDTGDTVFGDVNLYDYTLDDANNLPSQLEVGTGPQ
ncbi:RICIN domain-containing protein [Microbulbifer rhizosphaerae]|uniref:pectin lyase n=1 Tax=Microbulbifer rhizosphaerae TaxID=1562603 RepID=A0A7W4WFV8_9GAMM|nr:RICIN domain-containing protein [Microbulbifer rhizosphaerae]MBB3063469.1 pectate lyase [Microbulbifer rhizosphaerae]